MQATAIARVRRFLQALANQLVHPPARPFCKNVIFTVGASALPQYLQKSPPCYATKTQARKCCGKSEWTKWHDNINATLAVYCLPTVTLGLSTPVEDFNKMTDYDFMVIDVASIAGAVEKVCRIQTHLGETEVGIVSPAAPATA